MPVSDSAPLICLASLPADTCLCPALQAMGQQIIDGVAVGRGLPAQQVRSAMDSGPLLPEAALRCKLIDGILYRDEVGVVKASRTRERSVHAETTAPIPLGQGHLRG